MLLAWVVYNLSKNTGKLAHFEDTPLTVNGSVVDKQEIISEDTFDNAAMFVCFKSMRYSFKMDMLQTYDDNAEVEYLNESPISPNCRRTLNKERLFDPNDSDTDVLGLPEEREHRYS